MTDESYFTFTECSTTHAANFRYDIQFSFNIVLSPSLFRTSLHREWSNSDDDRPASGLD